MVNCTVCKLRKKPVGRDAGAAMANSLCDHECPGYYEEPFPGTRWPDEEREDANPVPSDNSSEKT